MCTKTKPEVIAAWEKREGSDQTLYLALPSSSGKGEYLIGVSLLQNDTIIIAHDCPASKQRKNCWHEKVALDVFKQWLWWNDLSGNKVVCINRKIALSPAWNQIPIPGQVISFDQREEEKTRAS
jgi:hypothetical protein